MKEKTLGLPDSKDSERNIGEWRKADHKPGTYTPEGEIASSAPDPETILLLKEKKARGEFLTEAEEEFLVGVEGLERAA